MGWQRICKWWFRNWRYGIMEDKKPTVSGKKGGGGGSTYVPTEAENSLRANTVAKIIDLLGEGEIGGPANGTWLKSTYLNEIPIQNADGSINFEGVTLAANLGTSSQSYIPGFEGVETTTSVNTDVTVAGGPITRTITDANVDTAKVTISIPTLLEQSSKGDLNKTTLQLRISVTPDNGAGTKQTAISENSGGKIYGKCISEYRKQYRLENLSQYGAAPWVITVERITPDSGSAKTVNAFSWYSYTTVIDTKLQYYDRAMVGLTINGSQFGNTIPTRAYKVNGRKIKIPDNYDPDTRTYTGDWSGTFTTGVTNNAAWVIYDIPTDKEIGLGDLIDETMVDKWSLYAAGVYADTLVNVKTLTPLATGGYSTTNSTEPRFSFNGVIENRTQGLEVISHLCSVLRMYPVWSAGQVQFVQDRPITTPARPVGLSNVSEEGFEYQGIPKRDRHSVVKVSWNDPELIGKLDVIEITDEEAIRDYGYNEMDFAAFGCTSRSEALRRGKYVLDTDANAREAVKFKGGMEWADALPGQLIAVQDPNYAGQVLEGRVKSATTTSVVLDKAIDIDNSVHTLLFQLAEGDAEEVTLNNSVGTTDTLTWDTPVTTAPFVGAQAVISSTNVETRKFILTNITETDGV